MLVGISHECDYPPEITHLPRVTTSAVDSAGTSRDIDDAVGTLSAGGLPVFAIDARQLAALAPTVILTQALCEVCAVSDGDVRDIAQVIHPAPLVVTLGATTLDGVWRDISAVGAAIGREREADALLESIAFRQRVVHETLRAARAPRPRVAVIEWLDPLYAAGHWTPNLVRRAGGIDVLAEAGAHSARIDVDRIREAAPDLLLFAPCGFDVERSAREARLLLATPEWSWARDIDAWALDGNALTSRPGPRLADAVEVLAAVVAPTRFAPPPDGYAQRCFGLPTNESAD